MKTKIQILKTAELALNSVLGDKGEWARVLFAPWVVLVIGYLVVALFGDKTGGDLFQYTYNTGEGLLQNNYNLQYSGDEARLQIFSLISGILMTINGFRYTLLKEGGKRWWVLPFNVRFFKLLICTILFAFLMFLFLIVPIGGAFLGGLMGGLLGGILGGILGVCGVFTAFLYPIIRLSLFDLFIAIDQGHPFSASWDLLKENVWRFAGLIGLWMIVYGVSTTVLSLALTPALADLILTPITTAFFIKGASLVYETLNEKKAVAKAPRTKKQK